MQRQTTCIDIGVYLGPGKVNFRGGTFENRLYMPYVSTANTHMGQTMHLVISIVLWKWVTHSACRLWELAEPRIVTFFLEYSEDVICWRKIRNQNLRRSRVNLADILLLKRRFSVFTLHTSCAIPDPTIIRVAQFIHTNIFTFELI